MDAALICQIYTRRCGVINGANSTARLLHANAARAEAHTQRALNENGAAICPQLIRPKAGKFCLFPDLYRTSKHLTLSAETRSVSVCT
jgi:hypothetical protein